MRHAIARSPARSDLEQKEALLFRPDGSLDEVKIEALLRARDQRPITISE